MLIFKDSLHLTIITLVLCHVAGLNAWDRAEESGKRTEPFIKIIQGPEEAFVESLASENANSESKRVFGH